MYILLCILSCKGIEDELYNLEFKYTPFHSLISCKTAKVTLEQEVPIYYFGVRDKHIVNEVLISMSLKTYCSAKVCPQTGKI